MLSVFHATAGAAILAAAAGACSSGGTGTPDTTSRACTFVNPVSDGADPWVARRGDDYFLVESRDNGIYVYRTTDLTKLKRNGVKVWTAPDTGWNRNHIWAPELHAIGGRWYIYYAGGRDGPPFIHQRSGVLESTGDDPQGQYVDKGLLYTGDDVAGGTNNRWAIDVTTDTIGGQRYAVWSGWETDAATDRTPQHLYIARMTNPYTIGSNRVRISSPVESWERGTELDLQEGPVFLQRNARRFLIYSTRESWLPQYRLGQLQLVTANADPMRADSWVKTGPVFTGTGQVHGVGHNSFTTSRDHSEDWIVYHSKVDPAPGWNRVIRMQKFTWNADGSPNFGTPVPTGELVRQPAGQC